MDEFIEKLGRKRDLIREVLGLTQAQTAFIENDDTDGLLTNIARRQKVIDKIDAIQAELPDKEAMRADPRCVTLITEVNAMLKAVEERDAFNEKAATSRMDALRDQMRKVNAGRKTFDGYEASGSNQIGGIYINQKK
ncbi:hypothetical protein FACS1894208_04190 [Clostridia bacterium]|nr:hypothetical protein FACS1894208_04190 [Clostridia bacterium]